MTGKGHLEFRERRTAMGNRYDSFVVRWWRLGSGGDRIQIDHIQSGETTLVATLAGALAWIAHSSAPGVILSPSASDSVEEDLAHTPTDEDTERKERRTSYPYLRPID